MLYPQNKIIERTLKLFLLLLLVIRIIPPKKGHCVYAISGKWKKGLKLISPSLNEKETIEILPNRMVMERYTPVKLIWFYLTVLHRRKEISDQTSEKITFHLRKHRARNHDFKLNESQRLSRKQSISNQRVLLVLFSTFFQSTFPT